MSTVNRHSQIVCFLDVIKKNTSRPGQPPETSGSVSTYDIKEAKREVVYLDVIPVQRSSADADLSNDIVFVHDDGEVRCVSGNLKEERWRAPPKTVLAIPHDQLSRSAFKIKYATVADVAAGREGVLRGQGDAIALLDSLMSRDVRNSWRIQLLVLISKSSASASHGMILHVLAICPENKSAPSTINRGAIRSLCNIHLPDHRDDSAAVEQVSVNVGSGTVQFISGGVLFTYDVAGTSPKLSSQLHTATEDIVSFLRLPSGHTLVATPTHLNVYDLFYQSVQTTVPIAETRASPSSSLKRKFGDDVEPQPKGAIELLTFFPRLNIAVGRNNTQLVGYYLNLGNSPHGHRKRLKSGSLIDAIGRGLPFQMKMADWRHSPQKMPNPVGDLTFTPNIQQDSLWSVKMEQLSHYAHAQDVEGFERILAAEVGVTRDESDLKEWASRKEAWELEHSAKAESRANGVPLLNGARNGHPVVSNLPLIEPTVFSPFPEKMPVPRWKWPGPTGGSSKSATNKPIRQELLTTLLGKIFSSSKAQGREPRSEPSADGTSDTSLRLAFYPPNAFRWLIDTGNLNLRNIDLALCDDRTTVGVPPLVTPEALVEALLEYDAEAKLVLAVLQGPVFLDAGELTRAAKPLIHRLHDALAPGLKGLNVQPSKKKLGDAHDIPNHTRPGWGRRSAQQTLDHMPTVHSVERLRTAFTSALTQLHSFASPRITKAWRLFLNIEELKFIIDELRKLLVVHGWTTWHLGDAEESLPECEHNGSRIRFISNLLNCALDSFEAAAWIYRPSNSHPSATTDELVADLQAEISAALEAVEAAAYLRGLLGGIVRPGKSDPGPKRKRVGGVMVVNPSSANTKMLPLGSKADAGISTNKVGAEGTLDSKPPRGRPHFESAKVGKYTIERIVI